MRNVTISMDEKMLEAGREYARRRGLSLNALIRELLRRTVTREGADSLEDAFALSDKLQLSSHGARWTRAELYDE